MHNNNLHYEICILGGGPAGLAAAIACANKINTKILVVEQQAPGQQRVGENVPPETLILLKKLGLEKQFQQSGHQPCPGFASVWGKDAVGYNDFIVNPLGQSWRLNRRVFDQSLANKATELGVEIQWQTRFQDAKANKGDGYTISLNNKAKHLESKISAGFIIDATGSTALFAKSQGVKKTIHDKFVATVRFADVINKAKGKQVRIEATPEGWCYHTLLPQSKVVSMIVSEQSRLCALKTDNFQPFEDYLESTLFIGEHLKKLQLSHHEYHSYPISSGLLPKLEGENWIAIGDAAASFDPIAAQGIYKALQHGLMAADKAISRLTQTPSPLDFAEVVTRQYQHYWQNRAHMYGLERRWSEQAFWRNRFGS